MTQLLLVAKNTFYGAADLFFDRRINLLSVHSPFFAEKIFESCREFHIRDWKLGRRAIEPRQPWQRVLVWLSASVGSVGFWRSIHERDSD
jgi:hypothetical protein